MMRRKILTYLIIGIVFIFFIKTLYQNFSQLPSYDWKFNYFSLGVSYIFLLSYSLVSVLVWGLIIRMLYTGKVSFRRFFKIYYLPYLGKYIPGKVWSFLGRVYLSQKEGMPKSQVSISIIWEQMFALLSGGLLFLFSLIFWERLEWANYIFIFLFIFSFSLLCLNPSICNWAVNFLIRRFDKNYLGIKISLSYGTVLRFIGTYCVLWIIFGISFYLFINSIYKVPLSYFLLLLGVYPASWIIGTLSFLTPAGIGVTEGVLSVLLAFYFPLPVAIIISLSTRIWLSIGEVICFGIALRL